MKYIIVSDGKNVAYNSFYLPCIRSLPSPVVIAMAVVEADPPDPVADVPPADVPDGFLVVEARVVWEGWTSLPPKKHQKWSFQCQNSKTKELLCEVHSLPVANTTTIMVTIVKTDITPTMIPTRALFILKVASNFYN